MKSLNFLLIMLFASIVLVGCSKDEDNAGDTSETTTQQQTQNAGDDQPEMNVQMDPNAGTAVYHYTCPNECEGSGSNQSGTCPVCGTAYVHNAEFHSTQQFQQQQQQQPEADPLQQQQLQQNQPESSAQNASGEYHYICSAGCEGGAAGAGTCAKCGGELVHNQAYHQ